MDRMLAGLEGTVAYIDDLLIKSATEIRYVQLIQEVFQMLQNDDFNISEQKCHFFKDNIKYISQITDEDVEH